MTIQEAAAARFRAYREEHGIPLDAPWVPSRPGITPLDEAREELADAWVYVDQALRGREPLHRSDYQVAAIFVEHAWDLLEGLR